MTTAFIARSMARRPHNAPVHRHQLMHRLTITRGGSIVAVFSRLPLRLAQEFAPNSIHIGETLPDEEGLLGGRPTRKRASDRAKAASGANNG